MDQTAQTIAALTILAAFGLSQFGVLHEKSLLYLLLNALGSEVLAFAGWAVHQWAFVILEGSWMLISAAGAAEWINRRLDALPPWSAAADLPAPTRSLPTRSVASSLGRLMKELSGVP